MSRFMEEYDKYKSNRKILYVEDIIFHSKHDTIKMWICYERFYGEIGKTPLFHGYLQEFENDPKNIIILKMRVTSFALTINPETMEPILQICTVHPEDKIFTKDGRLVKYKYLINEDSK